MYLDLLRVVDFLLVLLLMGRIPFLFSFHRFPLGSHAAFHLRIVMYLLLCIFRDFLIFHLLSSVPPPSPPRATYKSKLKRLCILNVQLQ